MSETIIGTLIGAVISVAVTVLTLYSNAYIEKNKIKAEKKQKDAEIKREKLTDVYIELASILNAFPKLSPNNTLENIEYSPHYSMESFDSIITILNYQIGDYKRLSENKKSNLDQKSYNETQISNREYAIKRIITIKEEYFSACEKYKNFCKTKKQILDLYSGQDVRDNIVHFEAIIRNIFVSGHDLKNAYDPSNNEIEVACRNVINSMRKDIGLN